MLLLRSMSLFDWREVDRIQVRRYDFEVDRSVLLGLRPNFRFLWIRLEGGPVLFCRLAIRMGEDVYKRVLGQWRIGRSPEADHLQSVFFEHWDNVVLESGLHGRPGASGNPKGRPKGHKSLRTAVTDIFTKKMTVRIRGKPKRVTSLEAVFMTILNKALKGDAKAIQVVNATAKALGLWDHVPQKVVPGDDLSHFTTQELEEFDRLLTKASAKTIPK